MSKLNHLIKEMCPEGIQVLKLAEMEDQGLVKLGRGDVISKTDLRNLPGEFPVYSSSAVSNGLFGNYGKFMFDDERITWSIDGGGRFFYRAKHKFSVTNVCGWLKVLNADLVNTRYLYYVLINTWGERTYNYTVKAHPSVIRDDYFIPLPPLKIQLAIVTILDKFTDLEADLEAELEAELEARKQQFEFHRENLLSKSYLEQFGIEVTTLDKVGSFVRGKGIQKSDLLHEGMPAIHYGEIHTQYGTSTSTSKSYVLETLWHRSNRAVKGDLIIATTSESVEDVCKATAWFGESEVAVSGDAMFYHHSLDPLFATYFFQSHHFGQHKKRIANGTKVKRISSAKMGSIEIYVPPMAEQVRIGLVLNQLESLYKDMTIGLPEEIYARRQQYEYYRKKILTLKELEAV